MFLWLIFFRFHQDMLIGLKIWVPVGLILASVKTLKNLLLPNYLADFQIMFAEMFIQAMVIGQKTWPPGGKAIWRFNLCTLNAIAGVDLTLSHIQKFCSRRLLKLSSPTYIKSL